MLVDAIVIAGGTPQPGDPLYQYTQGRPKALLEVGGRPMVHYVLSALSAAPSVRRIVVVGLSAETLPSENSQLLACLPNQGDMFANILAGMRRLVAADTDARWALIVGTDIPAITPTSIEWLTTMMEPGEHDVYYTVIRREVMEQRYPHSRRSYACLRDGAFAGGDVHGVALSLFHQSHPVWEKLIAARKSVWKLAALIGPGVLLRFSLGRLTLREAEIAVSKRLGVRGRAVVCPYAEIGMDVDKPSQYELICRELAAI